MVTGPHFYAYLTRLPQEECKYEHDYDLSDEQVEVLKENAKNKPCWALINGERISFIYHCRISHFIQERNATLAMTASGDISVRKVHHASSSPSVAAGSNQVSPLLYGKSTRSDPPQS